MDAEIMKIFSWYANMVTLTVREESMSAHFYREYIKESTDGFLQELKKHIDWKNLTPESCSELGFAIWDSDEGIDEEIESLKKPGAKYFLRKGQTLEDKIAGLERTKGIRLIPFYLLPIIPLGTELTTINGDVVIYDGHNVDDDIRFGCIAYGIKPITKEEKS